MNGTADWSFLRTFSMFGIGFPAIPILMAALPLSILIYIIAYGDFVFIETVVEAANKRRPDEKVDLNNSRAHVIVGIRNVLHMVFAPHPILAGPAYTAYSAILIDRRGRNQPSSRRLVASSGRDVVPLP